MATTKKKTGSDALERALVLVDVPHAGVVAGQILEAPAAAVAALQRCGEVDGNPAAIAHAAAHGAAVVSHPTLAV